MDDTQTVAMTASAAGYSDGTDTLDVTDDDTAPANPGNVDGDEDFDANDSFLIHLVKLSGTDAQIGQSKSSSLLTEAQIRIVITQLNIMADVDGDGDFDANDSFLIHLVKLAGTDAQIDQSRGGSPLTAAAIRANINALGGDSTTSSVASQSSQVLQSVLARVPKNDDAGAILTSRSNNWTPVVDSSDRNLFANVDVDEDAVSVDMAGVTLPDSTGEFVWEEFRQWIDAI